MPSPWITERGATGVITIIHDGDSWQLNSPAVDEEVICLVTGDTELSPSDSPVRVEGRVSKYTIGTGTDPNYLIFSPDGNGSGIDTSPSGGSGQTGFVATGVTRPTPDKTGSSSQNRSSRRPRSDHTGSQSSDSLDDIAEETIGDREFTVRENDESAVGAAKKRARQQGRDPAIDPQFQGSDEDDEG
jgi:hypothetical protein